MKKLKLVNHSLEELRTEKGKKKLFAKRIFKKRECAKRINQLLSRGDVDKNHINKEVWRIFNDMQFTDKELRDCMFNQLKQEVVKMARSHNKTEGAHRSIYSVKDMQIDIYTTRNAEALKIFIATMKSRAKSYTTTINDAICQLYRINHGIDNYSQVSLFDAVEEIKAVNN